MNWKNRLTNYNFWISIVSAVLLILQAFNIEFDVNYINEIITAVLGLLVVIGIINDPTKSASKTDTSSTITTYNAGINEPTTAESEKTDPMTNESEKAVDAEKEIPIVNEDEALDIDSSDNMEVLVEDISQHSENPFENISETDTVSDNSTHQESERIVESERTNSDNLEPQEENKTDANIDKATEMVNGATEPVFDEDKVAAQQDENRVTTNTFNIVNN